MTEGLNLMVFGKNRAKASDQVSTQVAAAREANEAAATALADALAAILAPRPLMLPAPNRARSSRASRH